MDESVGQVCCSKNHLLDMFAVATHREEYLLCFADYGVFVGNDGRRSRPDLIWRESASQVPSKCKLCSFFLPFFITTTRSMFYKGRL